MIGNKSKCVHRLKWFNGCKSAEMATLMKSAQGFKQAKKKLSLRWCASEELILNSRVAWIGDVNKCNRCMINKNMGRFICLKLLSGDFVEWKQQNK